MPDHADTIRRQISLHVANAAQLTENAGISQPTLSRTLRAMGDEIVRFGTGNLCIPNRALRHHLDTAATQVARLAT